MAEDHGRLLPRAGDTATSTTASTSPRANELSPRRRLQLAQHPPARCRRHDRAAAASSTACSRRCVANECEVVESARQHERSGDRRSGLCREQPLCVGCGRARKCAAAMRTSRPAGRPGRRALAQPMSSFTWRASTGPQRRRGVPDRQRRLYGRVCQQARARGRAPRSSSRPRSRPNSTTRTDGASAAPKRRIRAHAPADRGRRRRLPAQEPLRQVVPAQLQLGDRDLLLQHRPRPADRDLRSRRRARSHLYRRCGRGLSWASWSPARDGVPFAGPVCPSYSITLGELAALIRGFRAIRARRSSCRICRNPFVQALYATYLSYLRAGRICLRARTSGATIAAAWRNSSSRRRSARFLCRGRCPASRAATTITTPRPRNSWWSRAKRSIRFRRMLTATTSSSTAWRARTYRVVDIPPGYTHSIENVGPGELVTLFWASEIFDPRSPDTIAMPVMPRSETS